MTKSVTTLKKTSHSSKNSSQTDKGILRFLHRQATHVDHSMDATVFHLSANSNQSSGFDLGSVSEVLFFHVWSAQISEGEVAAALLLGIYKH